MINFDVDMEVSFAFTPHLQQTEMKEVDWFLRIKLLLNTVGIRKSMPKNVFLCLPSCKTWYNLSEGIFYR